MILCTFANVPVSIEFVVELAVVASDCVLSLSKIYGHACLCIVDSQFVDYTSHQYKLFLMVSYGVGIVGSW